MEPLELTHLAIMQEEGVSEQTLPTEFRPKFMSLQMMIGRYKNTPTESLKESIEKASANLGHAILDFVEKDLPDEGVNPDGSPIVPPAPPKEEPVIQQNQPPVPPTNEPPPPPDPSQQQPTQAKKSGGVFDTIFGW